MKLHPYLRTAFAVLAVSVTGGLIGGCDAGDTNPITPEKMDEIRQRDANSRGSFQPKTDAPPPSNGG